MEHTNIVDIYHTFWEILKNIFYLNHYSKPEDIGQLIVEQVKLVWDSKTYLVGDERGSHEDLQILSTWFLICAPSPQLDVYMPSFAPGDQQRVVMGVKNVSTSISKCLFV